MNILPHKSWHVYNKKNIEKVRKDEAKAQKEQEAKDKRALIADSEVRLKLLRQKANENQPDKQDDILAGHVRLFADAEKAALENEEVAAEAEAEKAKMDKQITMYLDKGAKDEEAPWYAKKGRRKYTDDHLTKPYIKSRHDKDRQKRYQRTPITLHNDDPLDIIKSHLDKDEKKKDRRKHKKSNNKPPSIEELRAQRQEREKAERQRSQKLIYGDNLPHKDPREQQYNSQYNRLETDQAQKRRRYL